MAREDFSFESARRRAVTNLTRTVIIPAVILISLVNATKIQLGYSTVPCYGLCVLLGSYLQGVYRNFQLRRDAGRIAEGKEGPVGTIPV